MKKQEQIEPKKIESIDEYLKQVNIDLTKWKKGNKNRAFMLIAVNEDGTVNEKGEDGYSGILITGGNQKNLSVAIYGYMHVSTDFEKIVSKASGKFALDQMTKLMEGEGHKK